ncbi:hypothetical protein PIB30_117302 [Stylosanthes scabra]|uniref:FAR1 domain-containing protein n=1 Tax=Stylosanthes scabra TaxID=79078 RepID=A0ABU6RDX9_9FABA|nr:hypothetical protein [Stylosanthes scabra]
MSASEMDPLAEELNNTCDSEAEGMSEGSEWSEEGNVNGSESVDMVIEDDCTDYGDVIELTPESIMWKLFRSEDAAYEFYKRFGKCYGFGIRKADFGKDDSGRVIRRRFFCNRAGLRDPKHYNRLDRRREHKPETRSNCEAKLSIYLDVEATVWRVRKVVMEHNHDLTPAGMIHMMPNFRNMTDSSKAQINGMQDHGITTSKILGYMVGHAGGYSFVGFTKKDAYNYVQRTKRARIMDGDSNATIGYLEGKATLDPMYAARYLVTEERMLANMFWADGGSRIDYQFFDYVIAFDSIYKKNKDKRPLVIFSGLNNHKHTTIFRFGLLMYENLLTNKISQHFDK